MCNNKPYKELDIEIANSKEQQLREEEFRNHKKEILKPTNAFLNGVKIFFWLLFDLIGRL